MPAPEPKIEDIQRGIQRYQDASDRPWLQTLNRVDWFISYADALYPLKYTFALAMNVPPATFTTDQMKAAMRNLNLTFHSLKAQAEADIQFHNDVKLSLQDPESRRLRLASARSTPKVSYTYHIVFQRNPDVVAEVLQRANGVCESCGRKAPFNKKTDGSPYLEVHHIKFLSEGGDDTVANAEALCPNCHREKHHD